ncbi:type II RES/Xre toxin-antitoxin system antitoxin [Rufibacter psychrotolerans]|uniref:type II RES/Xre toxin-antitoxin system antitoxin n=1 Tax=Rufibacter psychrotolerans TaxID=2812556 RepID=UPI0019685274|nr:antitoxin Xre/MbcA/ParS toxin-binding domain-containing protein [Rufibacter sp. SYSU D00308]
MAALNFDTDLFNTSVDDRDILLLVETVRQGIKFPLFMKIANQSPFDLSEWSVFLNLSERTIQRYKKEKKTFDPIHSEKILEVTLLYKRGTEVFGNAESFNAWLEAKNVALGGITPKSLLDTTFGIGLVKDELTRIEHGVLA